MKCGAIKLSIESDLSHVYLIGWTIHQIAYKLLGDRVQAFKVEVSVVEAVNNIIIHAYGREPGEMIEIIPDEVHEIKDTPRMGEASIHESLYNKVEDRPLQMQPPRTPPQAQPPRLVDVKTQNKLLDWLTQIQLIKQKATSVSEFPSYCRNGVLLSDLIQRIEGVFLLL